MQGGAPRRIRRPSLTEPGGAWLDPAGRLLPVDWKPQRRRARADRGAGARARIAPMARSPGDPRRSAIAGERTPPTGRAGLKRGADRLHPPVVRSKLTPPSLPPRLLARPGLVRSLIDHLDRPLISIVADAGYGKTTLLAEALRSLRRPVVWYSLMGSDADAMVFVRHLI